MIYALTRNGVAVGGATVVWRKPMRGVELPCQRRRTKGGVLVYRAVKLCSELCSSEIKDALVVVLEVRYDMYVGETSMVAYEVCVWTPRY